jgi:hypothetical protein
MIPMTMSNSSNVKARRARVRRLEDEFKRLALKLGMVDVLTCP